MLTIKSSCSIPEVNRNQFRNFLNNINDSVAGVNLVFSVDDETRNTKIFHWHLTCNTKEIADNVYQQILDGAVAHGGS